MSNLQRPGRAGWALLGVALAVTLWIVHYPVSDNIRYVLGLLRVSGHSPADTFTHRPIVYRLLMAGHGWLPDQVSDRIGEPHSLLRMTVFETGFNVIAVVAAVGAAVLLWAGLRRRWPEVAWVYGFAAYAALALLTPMLGEPDWYAAVFSVAAVGAGLLGNRWTGGVLGGVLLALAALVKFVTLPVALAALLVLWALNARRGWIAAGAAFVVGSLTLMMIWLLAPWEIGWMLDIRALQPPFWTGGKSAEAARDTLVQLGVLWPTVLLVPASFLGATRKEAAVIAGALVLTAAPVVLQGEYWLYHTISLVVLSCLLAVRTLLRSRGALFWPMVALSVWTALVVVLPWRFRLYAGWNVGDDLVHHGRRVVLIAAVSALALFALQWWTLRRQARAEVSGAPTVPMPGRHRTALVVLLAMLASQTPWALAAITTSRERNVEAAAAVRQVIGEAPVVYLTPGWATYYLGNPTLCRYPSPLFLQRSKAAALAAPAHRAENLDCVGYPDARWLVWNLEWLNPDSAADDVRLAIDRTWDCERAQRVGRYLLCPRRTR